MEGIVNFKKEKFLRDCRDFLKTGVISDELRSVVYNSTPAQMEALRKDVDTNTCKLIDYVIENVSKITENDIAKFKQKTNILCKNVLDTLETNNDRYIIKEVMDRYRDSINPIKALYYDLQEIIFLYDNKPKTKHHLFLIELFKDECSIQPYLMAIDKDLTRLYDCKKEIEKLKYDYKIQLNSTYAIKIKELYTEMQSWRNLIAHFPEWVEESKKEKQESLNWWQKVLFTAKEWLGIIE